MGRGKGTAVDGLALLRSLKSKKKTATKQSSPDSRQGGEHKQEPAVASVAGSPAPFAGRDDRSGLTKRTYDLCWALEDQQQKQQLVLFEDPVGNMAGGNGATLWDAGLLLAQRIERIGHPLQGVGGAGGADGATDAATTTAASASWKGRRVVELGSGVGLVSMVLGAMGAQVVATERDIALPLLEHNVKANEALLEGRVAVEALDWEQQMSNDSDPIGSGPIVKSGEASQGGGEDEGTSSNTEMVAPPPVTAATTAQLVNAGRRCRRRDPQWARWAGVEVVVGSDLAFPSNRDNYEHLADTLEAILEGSCVAPATVAEAPATVAEAPATVAGAEAYLAHETRRPEVEARFWAALAERGMNVRRLDNLSGDDPAEIGVYRIALDREGEEEGEEEKAGAAPGRGIRVVAD